MNLLITLLSICIVVILYLHVIYQLKTSNDLELYELDMPSKNKLEEVCNFRQPIVFSYFEETIMKCTPSQLHDYMAFDVILVDASNIQIPLPLEKTLQVCAKEKYYSAYNSDFLNETMLKRNYGITDMALRPPMVSSIQYDLLFGSIGSTTKLQYTNKYRNYFLVTDGTIHIKLAPPKNLRYLHVIKEYDNQEYYSPINPWNIEDKYKQDMDKVKFLEVDLYKGQLIFIPAYWWYSIQFEKDACVCTFQYKTVMNIIAILPDICLGLLQRQNTKTKLVAEFKHSPVNPSSADGSHT